MLALPSEVSIPWVLADNSITVLNKDDLSNMLFIAGSAQTALWQKYL
jgi:hypothetical protein